MLLAQSDLVWPTLCCLKYIGVGGNGGDGTRVRAHPYLVPCQGPGCLDLAKLLNEGLVRWMSGSRALTRIRGMKIGWDGRQTSVDLVLRCGLSGEGRPGGAAGVRLRLALPCLQCSSPRTPRQAAYIGKSAFQDVCCFPGWCLSWCLRRSRLDWRCGHFAALVDDVIFHREDFPGLDRLGEPGQLHHFDCGCEGSWSGQMPLNLTLGGRVRVDVRARKGRRLQFGAFPVPGRRGRALR